MNRLALACITGGWLLCGACAHHPQQPSTRSADTLSQPDSAENVYFPVADVLASEIREVDSTPLAIRKFVIYDGRTDSSFIKPAEFDALAMQFMVPEFRNGQFEKDFTETSFMDNATQDATFTYSATDKNLPLQRVDIIAAPHGTVHQLKSVYLERTRVSGDSSILEKMYWQAGKQFQVISLIRIKGGPPVQRRVIVSWDSGGDTNGGNE
jgi:hypothetical protein